MILHCLYVLSVELCFHNVLTFYAVYVFHNVYVFHDLYELPWLSMKFHNNNMNSLWFFKMLNDCWWFLRCLMIFMICSGVAARLRPCCHASEHEHPRFEDFAGAVHRRHHFNALARIVPCSPRGQNILTVHRRAKMEPCCPCLVPLGHNIWA